MYARVKLSLNPPDTANYRVKLSLDKFMKCDAKFIT